MTIAVSKIQNWKLEEISRIYILFQILNDEKPHRELQQTEFEMHLSFIFIS